jgi:hypothetical protein
VTINPQSISISTIVKVISIGELRFYFLGNFFHSSDPKTKPCTVHKGLFLGENGPKSSDYNVKGQCRLLMSVYFCNFYYCTYDSCSTNLTEFFFQKIIKRIQQTPI